MQLIITLIGALGITLLLQCSATAHVIPPPPFTGEAREKFKEMWKDTIANEVGGCTHFRDAKYIRIWHNHDLGLSPERKPVAMEYEITCPSGTVYGFLQIFQPLKWYHGIEKKYQKNLDEERRAKLVAKSAKAVIQNRGYTCNEIRGAVNTTSNFPGEKGRSYWEVSCATGTALYIIVQDKDESTIRSTLMRTEYPIE